MIEAIKHWAERRERVVDLRRHHADRVRHPDRTRPGRRPRPLDQEAPPIPVAERFLLVEDDRTVPYAAPAPDQLARLSAASRNLRDGRARRRDARARRRSCRPARRCRAGPIYRSRAAPRPRLGTIRNVGSAPVCDHRRLVTTGCQPRDGSASPERMVRASRGQANPRFSPTAATSEVVTAAAAQGRQARRPYATRPRSARRTAPASRATRSFLGESLGPTSVAIPEDQVAPLQSVLQELGITLEFEPPA